MIEIPRPESSLFIHSRDTVTCPNNNINDDPKLLKTSTKYGM